MKPGCLLFAHDGKIDYGSQAVLAAKLVKKHLDLPVHLVTDKNTLKTLKRKFKTLPFDGVSTVDVSDDTNTRLVGKDTVEFKNNSRISAYYLTPYERTLVIDTDFLVFSDSLKRYVEDYESDFMIMPGMLDLTQQFVKPKEYLLSDHSIPLLWATNFIFNKTPEVETFFNLIAYIKQEYRYFSKLYEFRTFSYRNDFAFSIACHMMSGYSNDKWYSELPVPLFLKENDNIVDIREDGRFVFFNKQQHDLQDFLIKAYKQDIHLMNKQDILDNFDKLMELANE
jgi:hypothetical protein